MPSSSNTGSVPPQSPALPSPAKRGRVRREVSLLARRHQRAVPLVDRAERVFGVDLRPQLVEVPRTLRFGRPLHLEQIGVMDLAPVLADLALAEQRIVGGRLLHLGDYRLAVGLACLGLERLEVVNQR